MIYMSFIIFVVVLIIVSFYFITSLIYRIINEKKIQEKKKTILNLISKVMGSDEEYANNEISELKKSFSSRRGIQAFHLAYINYVKAYGYNNNLQNLLNQVVDYEKVMKSKIVRKNYRKSFTLYLISEFQLSTKAVRDLALNSLEDDSIYVRNNALHVIGNRGDTESVLQALKKINKNEKYYNDKIVIDFLDNFKGDKKELDNKICEQLNNYNNILKNIIIEHLINVNNDDLKIRDQMLELLSTSQEPELLIKSTKYFSQVEDQRATAQLLVNMDSENWSLRATSAKTVSKYPGHQTVEKLKKTLSDPNYFVRRNSANSLIQMEEKEKIFEEALNNKDPFAKDILAYLISTSGIEGLEAFKERFNQASAREELPV